MQGIWRVLFGLKGGTQTFDAISVLADAEDGEFAIAKAKKKIPHAQKKEIYVIGLELLGRESQ